MKIPYEKIANIRTTRLFGKCKYSYQSLLPSSPYPYCEISDGSCDGNLYYPCVVLDEYDIDRMALAAIVGEI